jgi:hypothetical protein
MLNTGSTHCRTSIITSVTEQKHELQVSCDLKGMDSFEMQNTYIIATSLPNPVTETKLMERTILWL